MKMSTSTRTLSVCLLAHFVVYSVSEDLQQIKTTPGNDVSLQCQFPRDADIVTLKWIKPDLKSDNYVFFYRDKRIYENYQLESFHGRVELKDPEMKDGDVSVILKNININDAGTYECYVGYGGKTELINTIILTVSDSVQTNIIAEPGQTVTLPCRGSSNIKVTAVQWIRPDLQRAGYIFLFQDGRSVPDNQHPYYKNWVELKDEQMKDGDMSLILKNATTSDSGTYEVRVMQRRNRRKRATFNHNPISTITLTVEPGHNQLGGDKDGGDKDGQTEGGDNKEKGNTVGLVVGLLVAAVLLVVGFVIYKKLRDQNSHQQPSQQKH